MVQKVFITQIVEKYDASARGMIPAFDFSSAAQFGQLTPVVEPEDNPLWLDRIVPKIKKSLESFGPDDYLLAVGDPSVIAVCSGIILRKQSSLKMLKWDRQLKTYIQMEINP